MQALIGDSYKEATVMYRSMLKMLAVALIALFLSARAGSAQIVPRGFDAVARVESAYYRGDTLHVVHAASVSPSSSQSMWGFVVETPSKSVQLEPPGSWLLHIGEFAGLPSAQWIALGPSTAPGSVSPPFDIGAVGLADFASFWLVADTPPPLVDNPDAVSAEDQRLQRSIVGTTVGIVPIPANSSPAALANRLRSLLGRSCGNLGWIGAASRVQSSMRVAYSARTAANAKANLKRVSRSVSSTEQPSIPSGCAALDAKLIEARTAIAAGQSAVARGRLTEFTALLNTMRSPTSTIQVNGAAYALLASNVTYLVKRL